MSKLKNNTGKGNFFQNLLKNRKYRFGGFALLMTVLVVAAAVLVNVVLGVVEDNWALSIDLSPSQVTDFAQSTVDTVAEVDEDIVIYLLYQDGTQTELKVQLEEMAKKYRAMNSHITYDFIDPYNEPTRLARLVDTTQVNLPEGSVIVAKADDSKVRYIPRTDLYTTSYVADSSSSWGYSYQQAFNGEAKLTSAIKYVSAENTPNVYFLTGHNEIGMDYTTVFAGYLKDENYNVQPLTLGGDIVPVNGDTIIVTCPQTDMTDKEFEILSAWLQDGGRLLMTVDNAVDMNELTNFKSLLELYQLSFGDGYVVENGNATDRWISQPIVVIPELNAEHEITSALAATGNYLHIYGGRPINNCDIPLSGVKYTTLLSSSSGSYVKPSESTTGFEDATDAISTGSQILGYAAEQQHDVVDPNNTTRIVLLSSPYLYADTNILTQSYNIDFAMAAMEWLVNRDVSVMVRASAILNTTLNIPDVGTVVAIGVVSALIPLAVAVAGTIVWVRRRRL